MNRLSVSILAVVLLLAAISGCISSKDAQDSEKASEEASPDQKNLTTQPDQGDNTVASLSTWKISVNAKGGWSARISDDKTNEEIESGQGNETFYRNNTNSIGVRVRADDVGEPVELKIEQLTNGTVSYIDSAIGAAAAGNKEKYDTEKSVKLELDRTSVFFKDENKKQAYDIIAQTLISSGYRIYPKENPISMNQLDVTWNEEKGTIYMLQADLTSVRVPGTNIKCTFKLKKHGGTFTKIVHGSTPESMRIMGNSYQEIFGEMYDAALSDFEENLAEAVDSGLDKL